MSTGTGFASIRSGFTPRLASAAAFPDTSPFRRTHRPSSRTRLDDVQESAGLDATRRRYTHAYFGILEMAASCASAANAACVVNKSRVVGSGKAGFATGGKPVVAARATRASARRVAPVTRAVVTPPQTHDNARPDTTLRPVSAAAVDSSKALEQFRSMGGASRELIAIPVSFVSARPRATASPLDDLDAIRRRVLPDPSRARVFRAVPSVSPGRVTLGTRRYFGYPELA